MWISAAFVALGVGVALFAVGLTLLCAVRAASPQSWQDHWDKASYITFAWQELGRGVFFGYLFMLGMVPLTAFFFLGHAFFWNNFLFFSALIWGAAAILMYFIMVVPGIVGYWLHRRAQGKTGDLGMYVQVALVLALSAPFGYTLKTFLLPPTDQVFDLLVQTWKMYSKVLV